MGVNAERIIDRNVKIAVIGLGYVGLPLAVEFAKKYDVIGFDINKVRIEQLSQGIDSTKEANIQDLNQVVKNRSRTLKVGLHFSCNEEDLANYDTFIVTVPTPIDEFKCPDLGPLLKATALIGKILKRGNTVIYESTVYPGCTEEECIPLLASCSGLIVNDGFYVGYSPERINPGDHTNTLVKIKKVTSGSNQATADWVDALYQTIIEAGTYKAPSIKVAEASKAIENAQRDVNISFINELALIFDRMGVDTHDVIAAASTKWNFLNFKPGLVGGHCIGVDPYYLAHKAQALGYHPQVILSGRKVNDNMGQFIANKVVKLMIQKDLKIKNAKILILGLTFKENCPDIRNTRAIDVYKELEAFGAAVDVYDPWANPADVYQQYGITLKAELNNTIPYQAIILAVAHQQFLSLNFSQLKQVDGVLFDTKSCLDRRIVDGRL